MALLVSSAGLLAVPEAQAIGVAATDHVSQGAINGNGANPASFLGASNNGSRVFFVSAEPLASTDTDTSLDVYLREGSTTTQVSRGAINGDGGFDASFVGASSDGSRVFFRSLEQLASTDTDTSLDVYLREGSTTTQVSQGTINGDGAFTASFEGASSDGSRVIFESDEPLANTDTDTEQDLYLREGTTTTHLSQGTINGNGAFTASFEGASSDGSRVIFTSDEPLANTDTDSDRDLYLRQGTTTTHLSEGAINGNGAHDARFDDASSDGSRVFFYSAEPLASTDTDSERDLYLREGSTTTQVSLGAINGNGAFTATFVGASSDGSRVFFDSLEPLASTDTDTAYDLFAATIDATPPPTTTAPDTEITAAKLKAKKVQKQGTKVKVTLRASAGEPVKLLAQGKVQIKGVSKAVKLKAQRKSATAGQSLKLVLKPATAKAQRKILLALGAGDKATAKITVRFSDAAGNERVLKATIKLR